MELLQGPVDMVLKMNILFPLQEFGVSKRRRKKTLKCPGFPVIKILK